MFRWTDTWTDAQMLLIPIFPFCSYGRQKSKEIYDMFIDNCLLIRKLYKILMSKKYDAPQEEKIIIFLQSAS